MTIETYYHAGVDVDGQITWAHSSHTSREAAENQARAMACAIGPLRSRPVVEWWAGEHGPIPRDGDVVEGAEWL